MRGMVGALALALNLAGCGRTASDCEACGDGELTGGTGGTPTVGGGAGSAGEAPLGGSSPAGCNVGAVSAPLVRYSVVDLEQTLDAVVGVGPGFSLRDGAPDGSIPEHGVSQGFVFELAQLTSMRAQTAVVDESRLEVCPPDLVDRAVCVDGWIGELAPQLYGRRLTDAQVDGYVKQFSWWLESASPVDAARAVLHGMMLSPYFVFRIELGAPRASTLDAQPPGNAPVGFPSPMLPPGELLGAFEVAARLSHFVTRAAPDAPLLESAASGRILDPAELGAQFDRLSQSSVGLRARALQVLEQLHIDQPLGPDVIADAQVAADLREQANLFVQDVLQARSGSLRELLTSPRHFQNQRLSEHYGSTPPVGSEGWQAVELNPLYAGLFGHGAVLARYDRPTQRGAYLVMDHLFCQPIPPPPPVIDFPNLPYMGDTPRERLSSVTDNDPRCAACHGLFNPPGFALEAFDAQGNLTGFDTRGGLAAQVSRLGGPLEVDGPAGLGRAIAESPQAHACAAQRLLESVLGRPVTDVEQPLLQCLLAEQQGAFDLDLNLLARRVATSDALLRTTRLATPLVAVSSAASPIEHAVEETNQLVEAYSDPSERAQLQTYAELLRAWLELPN